MKIKTLNDVRDYAFDGGRYIKNMYSRGDLVQDLGNYNIKTLTDEYHNSLEKGERVKALKLEGQIEILYEIFGGKAHAEAKIMSAVETISLECAA